MTAYGTIVALNCERGFGFIHLEKPIDGGNRRIFFHQTSLSSQLEFEEQLMEMRVAFEVADGRKGKTAINVRPR